LRAGLFVWLVLLSLLTVACSSGSWPEAPRGIGLADDPEAYRAAAEPLAWRGNLHYQNFVIFGLDSLFLCARSGSVARLDGALRLFPVDPAPGCQFAWSDGWLFFTSGTQNSTVRKVQSDGSNAVRIANLPYQYLVADRGFIFGILTATGQVMRFRQDGTERVVLFDGFATELQYDGTSLYVCGANDQTGLIRIDPETGTSEKLLERRVVSLNVVGDTLYFADPDDEHRLYAWSGSDQGDQCLCDLSLTRPFIVYANWLYYVDTKNQNRLMRLPLKGTRTDLDRSVLVIDDAVASFTVLPDAVYYRRPEDNTIYRVPLAGGSPQKVS
jgi:hypothetical protein